jgi:hypothetical protein
MLLDPKHANDFGEDLVRLSRLPITCGVEIRRPVLFLGWLTKTKDILNQTFPNALTWDALPGMWHGIKINRLRPNATTAALALGKAPKDDEVPSIYYAFNNRALLLAPNEAALKRTADREIVPHEGELSPPTGRANAVLDIVPRASPELMKTLREMAQHDTQQRQLALKALGPAGGATVVAGDTGLSGDSPLRWFTLIRRLSADLHIRPDGMLLNVSVER